MVLMFSFASEEIIQALKNKMSARHDCGLWMRVWCVFTAIGKNDVALLFLLLQQFNFRRFAAKFAAAKPKSFPMSSTKSAPPVWHRMRCIILDMEDGKVAEFVR